MTDTSRLVYASSHPAVKEMEESEQEKHHHMTHTLRHTHSPTYTLTHVHRAGGHEKCPTGTDR